MPSVAVTADDIDTDVVVPDGFLCNLQNNLMVQDVILHYTVKLWLILVPLD